MLEDLASEIEIIRSRDVVSRQRVRDLEEALDATADDLVAVTNRYKAVMQENIRLRQRLQEGVK